MTSKGYGHPLVQFTFGLLVLLAVAFPYVGMDLIFALSLAGVVIFLLGLFYEFVPDMAGAIKTPVGMDCVSPHQEAPPLTLAPASQDMNAIYSVRWFGRFIRDTGDLNLLEHFNL